jgi:hypothetical protein
MTLPEDYRRDGHVLVRSDLPSRWHREMEERIDALSCPGNNLLAEIPDLALLFRDPPVHDALTSVLGSRWMLEPHRYAHVVPSGGQGTALHHDGFFGRPFDIRPPGMEAVLVLYYPHSVGSDDGPTVVVPGSHLRIDDWPDRGEWPSGTCDCPPLLVRAGTVAILDFALVHGSLRNRGSRRRQMVKFLVSGMEFGPFDEDRVVADLDHPDPNIRAKATLELARNADFLKGTLLARFIPLLDDGDRYVQAYAAEGLRRSDDPVAVRALLEWLWPRRWDPRTTRDSPF